MMEDYYTIGHVYVFKNLLFIIVLAICIIPFIYFRYIAPAAGVTVASSGSGAGFKTFIHYDTDLAEYTGRAKVLSTNRKEMYVGDVSSGFASGEGSLYNSGGIKVYEGAFSKNKYNGEGKEYYGETGNLMYTGAFLENLYEGEGKLYYPDGVTKYYEGEFSAGVFNGQGILYTEDGARLYEGGFRDGLYDGTGTLYYPDLQIAQYVGGFSKGLKSGEGVLYDRSGTEIFTGPFANDEINVSAFLGGSLQTLLDAYNTAATAYTFEAIENRVLEFSQFTDLFLINDGDRVERIIRLKTNMDFGETAFYIGETYADEADIAALNMAGKRKDFARTSAGVRFTDNVYRPQRMYIKTYITEDTIYTAFYEKQDGPMAYCVLEKNT